jgi:hypothetical protein
LLKSLPAYGWEPLKIKQHNSKKRTEYE